ncbi:MAG: roadblock/LC7 domain-containing protein [Pseudoclavibacter sp.]
MSRQEELQQVVGGVRRSIPELTGVMIASTDGLPIAHDFPAAAADKVAAMAATAVGLGQRVAERTDIGSLVESVFRGKEGYLVVYGAGDAAVLVLAGPAESNLGLMRIEARAAASVIVEALR